jgi:Rrf2 family protein
MRLGEAVEWSLHVCSLLATVPRGSSLPAARLAEFYAVPPAYLAKRLQQLAAAGIIAASRGRSGGYRLARPPREITLLEIVEAVEGRSLTFRCAEIRRQGPSAVPAAAYVPVCGIARAMYRADAAWRSELRSQTLAGIVASMTSEVSDAQQTRAQRWFADVLGADKETTR